MTMGIKIQSYTSLEQSQKLAEILPLESADMCWTNHCYGPIRSSMTASAKTIKEYKELLTQFTDLTSIDVFYPCWSLAALLDVLPFPQLSKDKLGSDKIGWMVSVYPDNCRYDSSWHDNPIDACYEMILKLHEENLL